MTEIELIVDLHKNTDRQGPGSKEDTLRALEFLSFAKDKSLKVVDIGCGSGGQTITLAQHLNGEITAVDLFPEFLDELSCRAKKLGLEKKITPLKGSMEDLTFPPETFDLIWSEGAIYIMGFARGIEKWKEFLKKGGYLALSEITWTSAERPSEIEAYWKLHYPEINTAAHKIKVLEDNGFSLIGYFVLPEESWTDSYYKPLEEKFDSFLVSHKNSELASQIIEEYKAEIELYRKFKDYFSYGFYIAQKSN